GPVVVAGPNAGIPNYIPSTGTPPAIVQPADSFMVYIGVPVDIDDLYLADGSHKVAGATPHGVYDLKRRWFSEVLRLDMPIVELLHAAGNNNTSFTQNNISLAQFFNAQSGSPRHLRVVFRVKTNRGFDDMSGGISGAYNSGHVGAALVDNVKIGGTDVTGRVRQESGRRDLRRRPRRQRVDRGPGGRDARARADGRDPLAHHPARLDRSWRLQRLRRGPGRRQGRGRLLPRLRPLHGGPEPLLHRSRLDLRVPELPRKAARQHDLLGRGEDPRSPVIRAGCPLPQRHRAGVRKRPD